MGAVRGGSGQFDRRAAAHGARGEGAPDRGKDRFGRKLPGADAERQAVGRAQKKIGSGGAVYGLPGCAFLFRPGSVFCVPNVFGAIKRGRLL